MRALTVLHRWFGVAFCLLFAMWFASGAVMHWLPFPELTEDERVAGLAAPASGAVRLTPARALAALQRDDIMRLRLVASGEHAVYIGSSADGDLHVIDAAGGAPPRVGYDYALAGARAHAAARGLRAIEPALIDTADFDQWTVSGNLDAHRPLFRFALHDRAGTELYVSSRSGEVVRDTTRVERIANYFGSVAHWIYPTALRKHWAAWDATVWWLSLIAIVGALAGVLLGLLRLRKSASGYRSPFRGWMYWHHVAGLGCATFLLTWIVSGWLSMDHGRIFSSGRASPQAMTNIHGAALTVADLADAAIAPAGAREFEWYRFAGQVITQQPTPADLQRAAARLGSGCRVTADDDAYAARSRNAGAAVQRIDCGEVWYQIDGADGRIIETLDPSRRAYRWAFRALHTLDFPFLGERPALRSTLIMLLCALGFAFSVSGVVIAWRRLKISTGGV